MARASTTLILSAWEPEIASLRSQLALPAGRFLNPVTRCLAVGIGAIDAAVGAARAIAQITPARVIFVGTAGCYPVSTLARVRAGAGAPPIGAVVLPEELTLCSTAALRGDGYLPASLVQRAPASAPLVGQLRRAAPVAMTVAAAATPLAITRTTALARRIARETGAAVENLEAFAVARAAAQTNVPMAAVLGIANHVGPKAHTEWRRNHLAASKAACAAVWSWLHDITA